MSRLKFTAKNIFFGYVSSIISLLLGFISRTIFIQILNVNYLGVNGLFANVLGVLSLAELGIGVAMNYSLYKPVAEQNIELIKSLMLLYKQAYRVIALVVALIGFAIMPFLSYIVKDPGNIGNISVYYLIFLFNTVTSYLVSYKLSLVNAEQKNYIFTNINIITSIVTVTIQIIILLAFKNFLIYLLTQAAILLIQKIFTNVYLNRRYPYLTDKNVQKLSKEELAPIKKNISALVWHKIGEISVYQTDNIIISAVINVTTVGLITNYNLVITTISSLMIMIFNSAVASLGNLVATESQEKQREAFYRYNFINFWLYGFSCIALVTLLQPFITLWLGKERLIDYISLVLICVNLYFIGQRVAFLNFKTAFGVFYDDKYIVLQVAVINLVISIVLANLIGLPGVYIGTIVSGLYQSIRRPIISYKRLTGVSVTSYFLTFIKYLLTVLAAGVPLFIISYYFLSPDNVTIVKFIVMILLTVIVPNSIFLLVFHKTNEFKYCKDILMNMRSKLHVSKK